MWPTHNTRPKTEKSILLQKAIEDKKFYHFIQNRNIEPIPYQYSILNKNAKIKSLSYIKSQEKMLISYKKKIYHPIKDQNKELILY